MKKFLFGAMAVAMLSMTSCNTDVDDTVATVGYATLNLVSPAEGESYITDALYKFYFNQTKQVSSIAMDGLKINNTNYAFSTDTVKYTQYYVQTESGIGAYNEIKNATGYVNKDLSLPVRNLNCQVTSLYYWRFTNIPGVENPVYSSSDPSMVIMQYDMGDDYNVKTVQPDAFYCGTTRTTISGTSPYETTEMTYRLKINKGYKTADMIIYNAKFAEAMPLPLTAVVLKDLPIKFERGSYSIEATNVVPKISEAGQLIDNDKYTFDTFRMFFTNIELTGADISYKVAGRFEGEVTDASYVVKIKENGSDK
ncbi:MAG: hypothetical protein K2J49_08275 [Muribaculaceae bacterium]|nr:hypothetical protein [Muribaculaceae bacterium]